MSDKDNPIIPPEHVNVEAVSHAVKSLGRRMKMDLKADTDTAILDEKQIAKVSDTVGSNYPLRLYLSRFDIDVSALCQTVRALREQLVVAEKQRDNALVRAAEDQDYDSEQRAGLAKRLAQVEQELNDLRDLNKNFVRRTRAIQLCRDKAAEWEALYDSDVSGDHDDKLYCAKAANEIREGLEKL